MMLSKGSVKLRSLVTSSFVLALTAGLAGAATTGCFFVGGHDHDSGWDDGSTDVDDPTDPGTVPQEVSQVDIQPDRVLESTPGEGVGIFVEYQTGGHWRVWTTCDTFSSKQICSYSIFASTTRAEHLRAYATEDAEGYDEVKDLGGGMVQFLADTDSDTDALVLDVEEGQPLDLEVYIDGQNAQPYVYWVSDDIVHGGAPDNPVRFLPQLPPQQG